MIHELKCWPEPFAAIASGRKTFEWRKADRPFGVGDGLVLREWCPFAKRYMGGVIHTSITYVLRGPDFGVPHGYCVLSLGAALDAPPPDAPGELAGGRETER